MTVMEGMVALAGQTTTDETYGDLLRSGSHWLFELTLELLTAPLAFALGWLWRSGVLSHVHRDLRALAHDLPRDCVEPTGGFRAPGQHLGRDRRIVEREASSGLGAAVQRPTLFARLTRTEQGLAVSKQDRHALNDGERARLKSLEVAFVEARKALSAKMSEHYPERGPRIWPMTDEEANAEIEPFAARCHEAEVAPLTARRKFALPGPGSATREDG